MRVADDLSGTQTFTTANSDLPDDDVRDVFVMATGAIVVATDGGLAWDCDRDLTCTRIFQDGDASLQSNQMTSVVELSNGRLVVGTADRITIIGKQALERMSGNVCRCGTYNQIAAAVVRAQKTLA